MTYQQYNIKKDNSKSLTYTKNRLGLSDTFEEKSVQYIIDSECRLIQQYQDEILWLEAHIKKATNNKKRVPEKGTRTPKKLYKSDTRLERKR